jgi:hypothetical protein
MSIQNRRVTAALGMAALAIGLGSSLVAYDPPRPFSVPKAKPKTPSAAKLKRKARQQMQKQSRKANRHG